MQHKSTFFDDMAKVASGAASSLGDLKGEMDAIARGACERMLSNMHLVRRDEFEAVKTMATKAREENEALKARLEALETKSASGKANKK